MPARDPSPSLSLSFSLQQAGTGSCSDCPGFPHFNLLQLLTSMLASSPQPTRAAGFSSQDRRLPGTSGICLWPWLDPERGCQTLQRNPVEHQLPAALSILRTTHHIAETFSCMAWLYISSPGVQSSRSWCHSLPLDMPPQREPDPKVHPSPASRNAAVAVP